MSLIGVLVEGLTEEIYFKYLLSWIQFQNDLLISKKLIDILDDSFHRNKIWLKNVEGDGSFSSYIKRNKLAFLQNDFDHLVLVRDYASSNRLSVLICKGKISEKFLSSIPQEVTAKYVKKIFINLSVKEIEAWFFVDKEMFTRLDGRLSEDYINLKYNNILNQNPEEIEKPASKLRKILSQEIEFDYRKREKDIYKIVSRINMDNYEGIIGENFAGSLNRIIQFFSNELSGNQIP